MCRMIDEIANHITEGTQKDYWEILNKKITVMVLDKYSQISAVESELKVSPTRGVPYLRSSIVERSRGEVKPASS